MKLQHNIVLTYHPIHIISLPITKGTLEFNIPLSVDDLLIWEWFRSQKTINTVTSLSKRKTHAFKIRSRSIQLWSSSRTRSTSSTVSALLRHNKKPHIYACENQVSSLFEILISLRPPSDFGTSFNVPSNTKFSHLVRDQHSLSSLSAIITFELPYQSPDENFGPLSSDLYDYQQRLVNQTFNHPTHYLRYRILPVN